EGAAFYGFKSVEELELPAAKAALKECDMLSWISKGDGPVYCAVSKDDGPIQNRGHWLHHPKHAEEIRKQCESAGVACIIVRDAPRDSSLHFLLKNLDVAEAE
ncbi:MAG: hypothetical protein U0984_00730, partial [Prosthecobacter sp.]|nr:hypothetical protein [Prosthecobacter sp.]